MPNRLTIPGLKMPKLSGWPLVFILGLGLAALALVYGSATGNLGDTCTMRVQAANAAVRAEPTPSSTVLARKATGTEVAISADEQRDGYRKLLDEDGWIAGGDVAATAGSRC